MKYEITCPLCGNNQVYQPRKEPPKQPHTKCTKCKKEFNFKIDNPDKTIIENVSKNIDKKPSTQKRNTESTGGLSSTSPLKKLSEDEIEFVIIEKLNKSLDNANIRLAIDFMKIKKSFSDLDQDLDIEQFIKRVNA